MKRLVAILSVVTALALSGVATAPALAGSYTYNGFTATCENLSNPKAAKYTLTYKTHVLFTHTFPGATCLF
jgi:hypothetical protein